MKRLSLSSTQDKFNLLHTKSLRNLDNKESKAFFDMQLTYEIYV
jgi:hypothetical protein